MSAPHLPKKTRDIKWHQRVAFSRTVLLVVILSLAAGGTAALVVLAWYPKIIGYAAPYYFMPSLPAVPQHKPPSDASMLARSLRNATVSMYRVTDRMRKFGIEWYPKDRAVGWGVFLTDDGWILTTADVARASTDLRIIDERGVIHRVQKSFHDSTTGFSFIKIEGGGFGVVAVAEDDVPRPGESVYQVAGIPFIGYRMGEVVYEQQNLLKTDRL